MNVQIPKKLSMRAVGLSVLIGANLGATLYLIKLAADPADLKSAQTQADFTLTELPEEGEASP